LEQAKPKLTKKTVVLPIVGILAFFLYIYLFNVDILSIIKTAQRANPAPYAAAILISFIEILFYSLSWREILSGLGVKLSIMKSYIFVWYAMFIDILIPAESVSGEVCRVYIVNREQNGTSGKVVASLVTYRLLSMVMNIVFLILGAALLFGETQINPLILNIIQLFVVVTAIMLTLLIIICLKESWSLKIINSIIRVGEFVSRGKWELQKIRQDACNAAKVFHSSMKDLMRSPKKLVIPTFYLALNWVASMCIPFLVFLSLGFNVSWGAILVTTSIVIAVKSIPVGIPFEVGLPEITMITLYASVGVPPEIAATSTILSRIITLWLRFGIGFVSYQWTEIKAVSKNSIHD
jgi:glycosyltransferase 2 family protein